MTRYWGLLLSVGLSYLAFRPAVVTAKPLDDSPDTLYPYSLIYKFGEFEGEMFYGAPAGTIVALKGTLGHKKFQPEYLGADVRPVSDKGNLPNPFRKENRGANNTGIEENTKFVVLGTEKFTVNKDGFILAADGNFRLKSIIYFSVLLLRDEGRTIVSNQLSFVVQIIGNRELDGPNQNAITAGILVLVIIFLGGLIAVTVKCQNLKFPKQKEDSSFSCSSSDEVIPGLNWNDHFEIKAEDFVVRSQDERDFRREAPCNGSQNGSDSKLARSDSCNSTLSWLRLNFNDAADQADSPKSGLSPIPEEHLNVDVRTDRLENNASVDGDYRTSFRCNENPSKSILKMPRKHSKHHHARRI